MSSSKLPCLVNRLPAFFLRTWCRGRRLRYLLVVFARLSRPGWFRNRRFRNFLARFVRFSRPGWFRYRIFGNFLVVCARCSRPGRLGRASGLILLLRFPAFLRFRGIFGGFGLILLAHGFVDPFFARLNTGVWRHEWVHATPGASHPPWELAVACPTV